MKSLNLFCVDACEKEKGFAELSQLTRVGLGLGSLSVVRNGGCASQMGRRVPLHDLPGAL